MSRNGASALATRRPAPLQYLPRLLVTVIRANPLAAVGLLALTVIGALLPAFQMTVMGRLVGQIEVLATEGLAAWQMIAPLVGMFALIIAVGGVLQLLSPICETQLRESLGIRMQKEVILKAQSLELAYFEHPDFYDSLQRANQDMSGRLVTLLRLLLDILDSGVRVGSFLVILFSAHWALAPIVVVGSIPRVWVSLTMNRRTYWVYRMRTPENRLAMYLRNLLTRRDGAKEVRLFTLADHLMQEWTDLSKRLASERRGLQVKQANLGAGADGIAALAYGTCLTILAFMGAGSRLTLEQYVTVTPAILQLVQRVEALMRSGASLQEQSLYLGDLYEFLSLAPLEEEEHVAGPTAAESEGSETGSALGGGKTQCQKRDVLPYGELTDEPLGEIRFEDVWFRYPGSDQFVLKGINLTLAPGERVALVGENGAGKSTLVRLLLGLYRPTAGRILIGGRDMCSLPPEYVRSRMSAVFQDFVQYLFTVYDNIAFGRLQTATAHDVKQAAEMAGIAPFIENLPQGYETQLGREVEGVDFSGGQWQKLALARALVRDAELIILDEPTAALDPLAEAEIYQHFYDMTRGRTSVLISHRLGSARMANRIVVLKGGEIVEEGNHRRLVELGGEYSRLFGLQAQWYM